MLISGMLESEETVPIPAAVVAAHHTPPASDGLLTLEATADGAHRFYTR
jgi:hypothetical protein